MMESIDTFQATCCLTVEKWFGYMGQTSEIAKLAYIRNASVKVRLTRDYVVVDLGFEDSDEFDYLQALELCKEFTPVTDDCKLEENTSSDLSLVLFITPKGEYDFLLMGVDGTWSFIPENPEEMCRTIQLIYVRKKFKIYKPEETVK